jgi:type II secretory pathway pseudopilin PulG
MRHRPSLHLQSGFTLVEVGIASVLIAGIVSGALSLYADHLHTQVAESQGEQLAGFNIAVNAYEQKYTANLASNQAIPVPGYTSVGNIYSPTPTELFHLGLLPNATPDSNYGVKISPSLVNGVPTGLSWISRPFTNGEGFVDMALAGSAMTAAGGDAAMSTPLSPAQVIGEDGWTAANPASGTPAGIVAMRNGAGSAQYVRLDGSTPMQGSFNVGGHDVTNAANVNADNITVASSLNSASSVTAAGPVKGQTLTATATGVNNVFFGSSALYSDGWNTVIRNANGALYVENFAGALQPTVTSQVVTPAGNGIQVGSSLFYGDNTNSAVRQNGTLYVQNGAGTGAASVDAARVTAEEYVQVNGAANVGWGCIPNGLMGRDGSGAPLFCVNGVWQATGKPNYVWVSAQATGKVSNLSATAVCPPGTTVVTGGGACDAGFATYLRYSLPDLGANDWHVICDDYQDRSPGIATALAECEY